MRKAPLLFFTPVLALLMAFALPPSVGTAADPANPVSSEQSPQFKSFSLDSSVSPAKRAALARGEAPAIDVPEAITLKANWMGMISASTAKGNILRWINPNPNLNMLQFEEGRKVVVQSDVEGVYPIYVYTAVDGVPTEPYRCIVTVGKPKPPTPPGPEPTPPTPPPGPDVDPALVKELKDLFNADGIQRDIKVKVASQLIALYEKAIPLTKDSSILTVEALSTAVNRQAAGKLDAGLDAIREKVAVLFMDALGSEGQAPFDEAKRKAAAQLFSKISLALKEVIK